MLQVRALWWNMLKYESNKRCFGSKPLAPTMTQVLKMVELLLNCEGKASELSENVESTI